jgi:hypothetical protein
MKLLDLHSEPHWQFRLYPQMGLQSFADFVADCPAVPMVNINGIAHGRTSVPENPSALEGPSSLMEAETVTFDLCAGELCPTTAKAAVSTTRQRSG